MSSAFLSLDLGIQQAAINQNTSGDKQIIAVGTTRAFLVYAIYLQVENTVDITFKSGTVGGSLTTFSGAIAMDTTNQPTIFWTNAGAPLWRSVDSGDDFVINLSGNVQINGWVAYRKTEFRAA